MRGKNSGKDASRPLAAKAKAAKPLPPSKPPFPWEMIYLFARIFYDMRGRCEDALKPYSVTTMQFTILATLGQWQGLSSAELSRRFNVTPQTMGEMIGNLERRLLVERRQDPTNRRALLLSLTPDGAKLVKQCNVAMDKVETQMLKGLSKTEVDELRDRLLVLNTHLGISNDTE